MGVRHDRRPKNHDCVIGLDVGGTKIAGGLVYPRVGDLLAERVLDTNPDRGPEAVLRVITTMAQDLVTEAEHRGLRPNGIGIGVPELVGPAGEIATGEVLGLRGNALCEQMSRVLPVTVESDVRAAAAAEAMHGAGRGYTSFVYTSVGTGISMCLVQDGRPYAGARGNALVLGGNAWSIPAEERTRRPAPLLEEFAAGPALVRRYNDRSAARADRAEDVLNSAAAGDTLAAETARTAADALGAGLAHVVGILDPAAIVVGGGLGLAGGLYWDRLVASTRQHIWADASRDLPIVPAALGGQAGVIGAALSATRSLSRVCESAHAE